MTKPGTPLIIGSIEDTVRDQIVETYRWASDHATEYELDDHFTIDDDTKQYELTARGRQKVRSLPKNDLVRTMGLVDLYEYTERAIKTHREFLLDRQYVVRPGEKGIDEIVIVDEFTGRLAEGRKWRDGIHQVDRGQGRIEDQRPDRPGRADHRPRPVFALRPSGRNDRDCGNECAGNAADLSHARSSRAHQPAAASKTIARSRVRIDGGQIRGDR